jgi:UDP-glucose 4-epimerase
LKIAITGVAGFIGSNLATRLVAEGHGVLGIDNLAYGVLEQIPHGVDFRKADIREPDLSEHLMGVDVLFHLAAKNSIADCQADPVEAADINVRGTANVLEAARRSEVRKVVLAETSALYEGSTTFPTPETDVTPRSFYAVSKLGAMHFAHAYERYHGMNLTALRYLCVYGPRQDYRRTIPPVMSAFIIKLLSGERPIIYGDGSKRRDFVFVDDVNDFHVRCISDPRTDGNTYNLGGGRNYSIREIYDAIATILGTSLEPEYRPDQPGEAHENLGDITAARSLGWEPRVGLHEGLERSIVYIRSHVLSRGGVTTD